MGIETAIFGAAALSAGSSLFGASQSASAARDAAAAQERAANKASDTQLQMYNRTRSDLAPWMNTGYGAFNSLANMYGLPSYKFNPNGTDGSAGSTGAPAAGGMGGVGGEATPSAASGGGMWTPQQGSGTGTQDFTAFTNSPDYQFAKQQGELSMNRSLAAQGRLVSGNALTAAQKFGQGLATQQFGNYFNRMMSMAGIGQNAAAGAGNAAMTAGGQVGASQMAAGQAQASGAVGQANAWNSGLSGVSNAASGGVNSLMFANFMNNRGSNTAYVPQANSALSAGNYAAPTQFYGTGGSPY